MTVPHRNDVPRFSSRRPNNHHHPVTDIARGDRSRFAVIPSIIRAAKYLAYKNLRRLSEIQTALSQRSFAFGRVEGDLHGFNVATKKSLRKRGEAA
jgi:hypothetical protein